MGDCRRLKRGSRTGSWTIPGVCFAAGMVVAAVAIAGPDETRGPRPVMAWAAGPFEARVVFDRPVPSAMADSFVGRSVVFDETRPTVRSKPTARTRTQSEANDNAGHLRVAATRLIDGGRTIVLTTDPHPRAGVYTMVLASDGPESPLRIEYDLTGVEASWTAAEDASPTWTNWWPSVDPLAASKALRKVPSAALAFERLSRAGTLALTTLLTLPQGSVTVRVAAKGLSEATLGGEEPEAADTPGLAVFRLESSGEPTLLTLSVRTGLKESEAIPSVRVTTKAGDGPESDVRSEHYQLPWTPPSAPPPPPLANVPDLSGGDPLKGALVFAGNEAKCANCHKAGGRGGEVGPDLANQVGRDRREVYRDIDAPSVRIHPDFVSYTIALKDGRVLVGTVRAKGAEALVVTDTEARATVVPRAEVEDVRPSATSIMPVGLIGAIGEARLRDLIAFLTSPPNPATK